MVMVGMVMGMVVVIQLQCAHSFTLPNSLPLAMADEDGDAGDAAAAATAFHASLSP